jgi:hypothetical protein
VTAVKLTAPDGSPVWVYPAWVQKIRPALVGERPLYHATPYEKEPQTLILLSGDRPQLVTESPDEVVRRMDGGNE